jgi:hypothetical protein
VLVLSSAIGIKNKWICSSLFHPRCGSLVDDIAHALLP